MGHNSKGAPAVGRGTLCSTLLLPNQS
jgi:hypothetical protein